MAKRPTGTVSHAVNADVLAVQKRKLSEADDWKNRVWPDDYPPGTPPSPILAIANERNCLENERNYWRDRALRSERTLDQAAILEHYAHTGKPPDYQVRRERWRQAFEANVAHRELDPLDDLRTQPWPDDYKDHL